jgi:hypothetical protein
MMMMMMMMMMMTMRWRMMASICHRAHVIRTRVQQRFELAVNSVQENTTNRTDLTLACQAKITIKISIYSADYAIMLNLEKQM